MRVSSSGSSRSAFGRVCRAELLATCAALVTACGGGSADNGYTFGPAGSGSGNDNGSGSNVGGSGSYDPGTGAGGAVGDGGVPIYHLPDGVQPPPPPYAIVVPEFKQPTGDPNAGYDYLVNGQYQRLGPDLAGFKSSQPAIQPGYELAGRTGDNVGLSYMFNAAVADSGDKVAAMNCLSCHATFFQGKLQIGLGHPNRMVRIDDVNVLGIALSAPFQLGDSVSTITRLLGGVNLGVMDVFPFLASHRDPKTLTWNDNMQYFNPASGILGWVDVAPWYRTKKKHALYTNGSGRGVQGHHMSFMSIFSVKDTTEAAVIEQKFNDVEAYLWTVKAPAFPGTIDQALASQGKEVFNSVCAQCHGTYETNWTYPNVIIPYQQVGTDSNLATHHWMSPTKDWYSQSWYARNGNSWIEIDEGYYAPPLDGIWATAPYFHNGSVPTLDAVIDPSKRPAKWTSSMTNDSDYDMQRVGWKDVPSEINLSLDGSWGTFDSSQPGYSNQGHTYGAALTSDQKAAVLEYLKTL